MNEKTNASDFSEAYKKIGKENDKINRLRQIVEDDIADFNSSVTDLSEIKNFFDVRIVIRQFDKAKLIIEKNNIDIFELKFLVENLDDVERNMNFFDFKEKFFKKNPEKHPIKGAGSN